MLLAVTSTSGRTNKLMHVNFSIENQSQHDDTDSSAHTRRALRGNSVCNDVFCVVMNVSNRTIRRLTAEVAPSASFEPHSTNRGANRKGVLSPQSIIVKAFLNRFAEQNSLPYPRGRGSEDGMPLQVLPSATAYFSVFSSYKSQWNLLAETSVS